MKEDEETFKTDDIKMKIDGDNFLDCTKCTIYRRNIKDLMKHLIEFHPVPITWMSEKMDINSLTPYTIVTDSRKKRKRNSIPRPLNSFMIFSRHLRRVVLMFFTDASNSEISKLLGKFWSTLPSDTKSMYDSEAKRLAAIHSKEFPDYKYRPQKKKKILITKSIDNILNSTEFMKTIPYSEIKKKTSEQPLENSNNVTVKKEKCEGYAPTKRPITNNAPINKESKQKKLTISYLTTDELNDTESSASSPRLTNKAEMFYSISPMSDQSFESLSERNFSPNVTKHDKFKNQINFRLIDSQTICSTKKFPPLFNCQSSVSNGLYIRTKDFGQELPLPFTRPLSIITENPNYQALYILANSDKIKVNETPSESFLRPTIAQINNQIFDKSLNNLDGVKIYRRQNFIKSSVAKVNKKLDDVRLFPGILTTTSDPFIMNDLSEPDQFVSEYFSIDSQCSNNNGSWLLQSSPNYKLSTVSSLSSDTNCQEMYGSPSPFLLSENDQNSIPIQKLPAIGSWLRPNNSEHTI